MGDPAALPLVETGPALQAGRKVILGIRPEHLSRQTPETAGRAGMVALTAPVAVVEPTGAETMAVLQIGGKEITGRFDPNERPVAGEAMVLNVDMTRACLFDPASQAPLRPHVRLRQLPQSR